MKYPLIALLCLTAAIAKAAPWDLRLQMLNNNPVPGSEIYTVTKPTHPNWGIVIYNPTRALTAVGGPSQGGPDCFTADTTYFGFNATTRTYSLNSVWVASLASASDLTALTSRVTADEAAMVTMVANMASVDADILALQSGKEPTIAAGTTGQYWRGDKTWQTLNSTAVGLSNVPNVDATNPANITQSSAYRFASDTEKTTWNGKFNFPGGGSIGQFVDGTGALQVLPTLDSMGIEAWANAKNYATNGALTSGLNSKFDNPTGSASQYIRGNGTLATFPTAVSAFTNDAGYVNQSGARTAISLTTTGTSGAASYNNSTGVLNVPVYPTPSAPTQNDNVSRSLNSNFTISTTQRVRCSYSINASWTLQALLSGSGSAFLEYSTNAGTTWVTANRCGKGLNLLTFAGNDDMNLVGEIPANALVRIRTTATNMTITYTSGQEILY